MLQPISPVYLKYKTSRSSDGTYCFTSLYFVVDDAVISNPEEVALLSLIKGDLKELIDKMMLLSSKKNTLPNPRLEDLDLNCFFDYCFDNIPDGKPIDDVHEKYGELASRTILAFPYANECFDGKIGFLSYFSREQSLIMWKDFSIQKIEYRLISYCDYLKMWQTFMCEANC